MNPIQPSLFVVGTSIDPHIDAVLSHLGGTSVCRLDVDKFPANVEVSVEINEARVELLVDDGTQVFDVSNPRVAWFRRFGKPGLPATLDPDYKKFSHDEAEQTVQGLLDLCRPERWVNEYRASRLAASKPYQYALAGESGLTVPATLITNSPSRLKTWIGDTSSEYIIKSISRPLLTETTSPQGRTFAYTSRIDRERISDRQVHAVPSQVQPLIDGAYEVRVTSIRGEHMAVAISTSDDVVDRHDWRATQDTAHYSYTSFPPSIATALDKLLSKLGIDYAASDFIVTRSGDWIFLESNPHGAWLWMEKTLEGTPSITERISQHFAQMIRSK
jgi:hypothetical protein